MTLENTISTIVIIICALVLLACLKGFINFFRSKVGSSSIANELANIMDSVHNVAEEEIMNALKKRANTGISKEQLDDIALEVLEEMKKRLTDDEYDKIAKAAVIQDGQVEYKSDHVLFDLISNILKEKM